MLAAAAVSTALFTLSACGGSTPEKKDDAGAPRKAAPTVSVKLADSEYGRILVDQSGRTLYAFTKDKGGVSNCGADCIAVWPAVTSSSDPKAGSGAQQPLLEEKQRTKGVAQVMYNKWPLYYYVGDAVAGEANGQGTDGEWFVVSADGKLVKKQAG
jgi:predicted lipoprotein with Yx(FWY)xxD motif